MLRVKLFLRYSTVFREARRFCSSGVAEQWIKRTFFQPSTTTHKLALPDLIITSPTMKRSDIDTNCNKLTRSCIIETADSVMGLPLIDFDLQKYCNDIEKASLISPDLRRKKPLFGVVRGMGGGKTRSLEEIRRQLLMKSDTLPIAITFSASWDLHNDRWETRLKLKERPDDSRLYVTLAIISRMASMLYHEKFKTITDRILDNINDLLSHRNVISPEALLSAFINCIVEDVSRHRGTPVTKFILLIDETMKLVERVDEIYGKQSDVMSMVRDVLLNGVHTVDLWKGQEKAEKCNLNVALVISSLNVQPLGKTTSGRPVIPIFLPQHLNSMRVCDEIFLKHEHTKNLSAKDRIMFHLIAASLSELPRLVQFANDFISENKFPQCEEMNPQDGEEKKRIYFSELYEYVCRRVSEMYSVDITNGLILYAIVFGFQIRVTEPVMEAITCSLITNSISDFQPKSLAPNGSLIMMYVACQNSASFAFLDKSLKKIFGSIVDSSNPGKVLEMALLQWLRVRLFTASAALGYEKRDVEIVSPRCSPNHFSVRMLLHLKQSVGMYHGGLLDRPLNNRYSLYSSVITLKATVHDSSKNYKKYFNELKSCGVDENIPIAILKSAEGDAWDVGLKVFDEKNTSNPMFIFIDCKSADEPLNEKDGKCVYASVDDLPNEGNQYKSMKNFCEKRHLRFVYIYLFTHDVDGEEISKNSKGSLIVMGRDQSKSFFGPIFQFYAAARLANAEKQ